MRRRGCATGVSYGRQHITGAALLATTVQTPERQESQARAGLVWRIIGVAVAASVLFVTALLPRTANLDRHATADEDLTLIRSANVALAIERGDWWGTYQIGHPEATVQLLVARALGPDALRPYAGDFLGPDSRVAARTPGYFEMLVQARQVMAPVHAVLIVVAALLAWRLWGVTIGLLAGLLLALEPFMVAHGRILRTDAMLAELMLVAILAALAYWSGRAGLWALGLCTVATGLAWLTKTPALALLGAVPFVAVVSMWASRTSSSFSSHLAPRTSHLIVRCAALAGWLAGSAALVYALWPAMWARPMRALERMAVYTQEKGGSPMDAGGYFLGTPIPDPGPLYYAVALPLRLGPLVLVGLALWLLLRAPRARQGIGLVLLIGLGLAAVLALLPKKADRYVLPAMPFLMVVAAVGIGALAERWRRLSPAGALGLVAAIEVALLVVVWPYPLAAYNPLLGGGSAAERWISVGWGEGLDQLAPALNERPDAAYLTVATPYPEVLQAGIVGRAVDLDAYDVADYAVRYVAASQRHLNTPAQDAALAGREPLKRVEIAGIPYAELYELDRPSFAGNLQVSELDVSPSVVGRRGWVTVRLSLGPPSAEGRLDGVTRGQTPFVTPVDVEVGLANSADPTDVDASVTRSLLPDGSLSEVKLRTSNGLGRYVLTLRIHDSASGTQYAVTSWPVGAPRLPDRMVFPSLDVRVQ